MVNVNATNFRQNVFGYLDQVINYSQPVNIATKHGDAVLISGDDYRSLMETFCIESIPGLKDSIVASMNTPISEGVSLGNKTLSQFLSETTD